RKVETTNKAKKEKSTVNVLWTQSGEEQREYANLRLFDQCLLAAPVTGDNHGSNLTPINGWVDRPPLGLTTNWRAGCRRSASPVRREGQAVPLSLPLSRAWADRPRNLTNQTRSTVG